MPILKVIIIGAGLGGLSLAQALRRDGLGVEIFERDRSPFDRPQGYRLHLDSNVINAAKEVLTPEAHDLFVASSQRTEPCTTLLGRDLAVIKRIPTQAPQGDDVWSDTGGLATHYNVDRATLRQILLAGLEDAVHFGKSLDRYESDAGGVTVFFTDGTSARGDVLVGADGIRSVVRRQRAPHAETVDAGITAIYGRVPLVAAAGLVPRETLEDIFTIASDDRKVFLGMGSVRFPMSPPQAAARFAPELAMLPQDDYVVCVVGGRHEFFPGDLRGASGERLRQVAAEMLSAWPPRAADIVRAGDADAFFLVEMYTSVPCELDTPVNVTLLGDAIHAMTPTLGRGANVAMRDGALLGRRLKDLATGRATVSEALTRYESGMLKYGFDVVREAASVGAQRIAQNALPSTSR